MHDQEAPIRIESAPSSDLGLDDIISFGRRQGPLIVLAGFLAALAAGVATLMQPPRFEANATLVVFPPPVTSELTPTTLTVLGFQKLLESDAVVYETKRRLVESGRMDEETPLSVPADLGSRIFVSRRAEEQALAPMIQMFGRSDSADLASEITNTWAAAFLDQARTLVSGSTAATVDFVDRQYEAQRESLAEGEDQMLATKVDRGRSFETLSAKWLRSIADREAKNAEAVATHAAETRRALETLRGEKNYETREEQLDAMRQALVELQVEQASVQARLARVKLTVASLKEQTQRTSPVVSLNKAITDDALWNAVKREDGTLDWSALGAQTLVTEDVNPVFTDLMERLGVAEANMASLEPRAEQLRKQIADLRVRMDAEEVALRDDMAELGALQQSREAGHARLTAEVAAELAAAELTRDRLLKEHEDETARVLKQMRRDVDQRLELFKEMTISYNQAVIAKAQQDLEEIRLGAAAVPPDRALSRRLLIKAALAGIFGMLIGVVIALVRDRRRAKKAD